MTKLIRSEMTAHFCQKVHIIELSSLPIVSHLIKKWLTRELPASFMIGNLRRETHFPKSPFCLAQWTARDERKLSRPARDVGNEKCRRVVVSSCRRRRWRRQNYSRKHTRRACGWQSHDPYPPITIGIQHRCFVLPREQTSAHDGCTPRRVLA